MALSKYDISAQLVNEPETSHAFMVELTGSNKRVLDVGCDTGYLGVTLQALGCTVSGVEIDPVTAAEAAKHLERVVVADLERDDLVAEFGAEAFDVVIFGDVLEHLRDPLPVLRSARRLLSAGGSVIISTPNIAHGDIRLALLHGRWNYTKVGILDETHTRFFTRDNLVQFLTDAGFVLAELRRTRAPLFATETGVHEADFDPDVVAALRADPEADTYQFVLRAVPDDVFNVESTVALRADDLANRLRLLEAELARTQQERDCAREESDRARAETESVRQRLTEHAQSLQGSLDVAIAERDQARTALVDRSHSGGRARAVARRVLGRPL